MTTRQERKKRYHINVNSDGNWYGRCPDCGEEFHATHPAVSQAHVIQTIQRHREEMHGLEEAHE